MGKDDKVIDSINRINQEISKRKTKIYDLEQERANQFFQMSYNCDHAYGSACQNGYEQHVVCDVENCPLTK